MKIEVIIAPLAVLLLIVFMAIAARFYDHLPIKPPPCGFRKITGLPCVSCRGTRSFRALVNGQVRQSLRFNPLVGVSLVIAGLWMGGYVIRRGEEPRYPVPLSWTVAITLLLLVANWIYLILTNHLYPD